MSQQEQMRKLRAACMPPTPGYSLESIGHAALHLDIVEKNYLKGHNLTSYFIKAKSRSKDDISKAGLVARLMGKELVYTNAKAIGCMTSTFARELRMEERGIEKSINPVLQVYGATYIVMPYMFSEEDFERDADVKQMREIGERLTGYHYNGGGLIASGIVTEAHLLALGDNFRDYFKKFITIEV